MTREDLAHLWRLLHHPVVKVVVLLVAVAILGWFILATVNAEQQSNSQAVQQLCAHSC